MELVDCWGLQRRKKVWIIDSPARSDTEGSVLSFLAYVDLLGTTYTASTLATGYGSYIAQPLLRKAVEGHEHELTEEQALAIIEQSMKVLFYRDARSIDKVSYWVHSQALICADLAFSIKLRPSQPKVPKYQNRVISRRPGLLQRVFEGMARKLSDYMMYRFQLCLAFCTIEDRGFTNTV